MQSASFCGSDVFHRRDFCRRQVVELINEAVNLDFEGGYVGIWAGAFGSGSRVQQANHLLKNKGDSWERTACRTVDRKYQASYVRSLYWNCPPECEDSLPA